MEADGRTYWFVPPLPRPPPAPRAHLLQPSTSTWSRTRRRATCWRAECSGALPDVDASDHRLAAQGEWRPGRRECAAGRGAARPGPMRRSARRSRRSQAVRAVAGRRGQAMRAPRTGVRPRNIPPANPGRRPSVPGIAPGGPLPSPSRTSVLPLARGCGAEPTSMRSGAAVQQGPWAADREQPVS